MKNARPVRIPARKAHVKVSATPQGIEQLVELINTHGVRPPPQQQIADYFEQVAKLCGNSPEPGTVEAEIGELAEGLRRAIAGGDPHLIAVRALELGEYRFWPGAVKHEAQTSKGRGNLAASNTARQDAADKLVVDAFGRWQRKARGALRDKGIAKPARKRAELFAKYSSWKPKSAERRRLYRLAAAGKLPDLPV